VSGTKQDFLRVCENKRAKKLCDCWGPREVQILSLRP
jgi:hypothetical protein